MASIENKHALPVEVTDVGVYGIMRRYGDLCMHVVLDLRRSFTRGELERAMASTLADFPVLGHRYVPGFWRDRWEPVDGPVSDAVHVEETPELDARTDEWVRRSPVATRDRQLRLVGLVHRGRMRLILSIMHLAVDGAGVAAVGHVLGSHLYGVPPSLPVEPRRDIWRAIDGLRYYHLPPLARDLAKIAFQPFATFAAARRERPYPTDGSLATSFRHVVITARELARVKQRCRLPTSVNDVLVAALARAAASRSRGGPVVVTYTMDLRRYGKSPRLTAANSSSILSVIVPREATGDLATAAAAVAALTVGHRRGLAGPAFFLPPYALGSLTPHAVARGLVNVVGPALVEMPLRRGLLLTNVGRIDDGLRAFGDDVEDVHIVGPNIERLSAPAVVAFGFRGEVRLELFAPPGSAVSALEELESEIVAALELEPRPRGRSGSAEAASDSP